MSRCKHCMWGLRRWVPRGQHCKWCWSNVRRACQGYEKVVSEGWWRRWSWKAPRPHYNSNPITSSTVPFNCAWVGTLVLTLHNSITLWIGHNILQLANVSCSLSVIIFFWFATLDPSLVNDEAQSWKWSCSIGSIVEVIFVHVLWESALNLMFMGKMLQISGV